MYDTRAQLNEMLGSIFNPDNASRYAAITRLFEPIDDPELDLAYEEYLEGHKATLMEFDMSDIPYDNGGDDFELGNNGELVPKY